MISVGLFTQRSAATPQTVLEQFYLSAAHQRCIRRGWWGTVVLYETAPMSYALLTVNFQTGPKAVHAAGREARVHFGAPAALISREMNQAAEVRDYDLSRMSSNSASQSR